ncbi:hypothetical protein Q9L58_010017 [Maublancomyces gigas]|uniref:Uncharacterized protein n=1 Tax=Discina gigas TaxID=1032678 RepID=A0ABR3G5D6_9PEZI
MSTTPAMVDSTAAPNPPVLPLSLDSLVFALSQIISLRDYRPPSVTRLSPTHQKSSTERHLRLLNLLSLLLVTGEKGDVAAVALRLRGDSAELYYAKNRPCTKNENDYIKRIFGYVTKCPTSPSEADCVTMSHAILREAIPACRIKLNSRITRLVKRLGELGDNFGICYSAADDSTDTVHYIRKNLTSKVFKPEASLSDFLQAWFKSVQTRAWESLPTGSVYQLIWIAYYVGTSPDIRTILDNALVIRLLKLGDYFAVPIVVQAAMSLLTTTKREDLSVQEIVPELQRHVPVPSNFLATVNSWAIHNSKYPTTAHELTAAFPQHAKLPEVDDPPALRIRTSVHCECTLVMALVAAAPSAKHEIGVSKSLCWMCREFILIIQRMHPLLQIHTSSCHGKLVAGWRIPEGIPREVVREIMKQVHDEVDEVLDRAARNRKSDSIPRATGSEDSEEKKDPAVWEPMFNDMIEDAGWEME